MSRNDTEYSILSTRKIRCKQTEEWLNEKCAEFEKTEDHRYGRYK